MRANIVYYSSIPSCDEIMCAPHFLMYCLGAYGLSLGLVPLIDYTFSLKISNFTLAPSSVAHIARSISP